MDGVQPIKEGQSRRGRGAGGRWDGVLFHGAETRPYNGEYRACESLSIIRYAPDILHCYSSPFYSVFSAEPDGALFR